MSKIICDICGTTYSDVETQCPICGSTKPADPQVLETSAASSYTYVKGGRFSKSNVRKRNGGKVAAKSAPKKVKTEKKAEKPAAQRQEKQNGGDNRGLVITAIVLLVAVIVVVGYIAARYFIVPENEGASNIKESIACVSLNVDKSEISMDDESATYQLKATPTPTNTTDKIKFESLNPDVATVDGNGKITALTAGTAQIKITCGSEEVTVTVNSTVGVIELRFIYKTNTLKSEGETCIVYIKETSGIDPADITWTTDDEKVATISDGVVQAVGEGVTKVYGEYKGAKAYCTITVDFEDEEDNGNGIGEDDGNNTGIGEDNGNTGIGEDDGNNTGIGEDNVNNGVGEDDVDNNNSGEEIFIYTLWNTKLEDFTVGNGKSETLVVKDSNGNEVEAVLTVDDENVCTISGNVVTGHGGGVAKITATYNGITATCTVRSS